MIVQENKTDYDVDKLINIAQRENNEKRKYLIVNNIQGKHIPVNPVDTLNLFYKLSKQIKVNDENIVFIGFAETATAIGFAVASKFKNSYYIQTTRENIDKKYNIVDFNEEHSHAVEQKLFCQNKDILLKCDIIIFVEDEVTTGKTILNFIHELEKIGINKKFAVACIVNSMNETNLSIFNKKNIDLYYLLKLENNFNSLTFSLEQSISLEKDNKLDFNIFEIDGRKDTRLGIISEEYQKACENLAFEILKKFDMNNKSILIMGTEEFMYPSILCGKLISEKCNCKSIKTHSTTRSPIIASKSKNYPIKNKTLLRSFYDNERKTYIYNLDKYDKIIIITDSLNLNMNGVKDLVLALRAYQNDDINIIRWVE